MAKTDNTIIFGKKVIESLPIPEQGMRKVYSDKKTPYLFLRVTPSARTFFWQKRIRGAQKTVTIGKFPSINAEQARDKADWIAAQYVQGIDVQAENRKASSGMTLGELWADFRVNRARGKGRISESNEYLWELRFSHWKDKPVTEIDYDMGRKLILDIRKTAPIHGNRVQRLGKAIWNHGIKELRLKIENPFTFAQVSEKGRSRKKKRVTRAQMPAFFEALNSLAGDNMKDLFLTSLFGGRRIGECKAMRWADIDLMTGVWAIPTTKAGEPQVCVIPGELVKILEKRQGNKSEWVFPAHSKTGHVEAINNAWEKVRAQGFQDLRANDLRGTLASFLQEEGASIALASAQLGHADVATTAEHYTNIEMNLQRIGMDSAVNAMLEPPK
jgi:integrase